MQSQSPVVLTQFGEEISATVSARAWAERHAPNLVTEASGMPEFEVFEICVNYILQQFENDSEFGRTIRAGAYEHGTEPGQVRKVFEVELRDRLLELLTRPPGEKDLRSCEDTSDSINS